MFNIEEKIINWFANQKLVPIVKKEPKKDKEEVVYTTSNKSTGEKSSMGELKNSIRSNNSRYNSLKGEVVYEFNNNPAHEYSDESLEIKAGEIADDNFEGVYRSENLKNETNVNKLNEKEKDILKSDKVEKEKIDSAYKTYLNGATDNAIKNGISRSSILDGEKEKISSDKEKELDAVEDKTQTALDENERDKQAEKERHDNAITEIDGKKEKEKNKQLGILKEERQTLVDEGKLTANYNNDPNYVSPEMLQVKKDILKDVLSYFYSMDKEEAIRLYEGDLELQELLGDLEPAVRLYVTGKGSVSR